MGGVLSCQWRPGGQRADLGYGLRPSVVARAAAIS
jgi:hypothetical protein